MTLDEAIAHTREVAETVRYNAYTFTESDLLDENCRKAKAECLECVAEHEQLADWLEELKTRCEADKWINVKERLPEESDFYIVTIADKYTTYVTTLFFMKSTPDMWEHDKRVLAWKPLPEPYKESEATND